VNCDQKTARKVTEAGFKALSFQHDDKGNMTYKQSVTPIHVERFMHIYNYLSNNEYRYVIATDVRDVIFQKNPSIWLDMALGAPCGQSYNCVFSSESILYKDEIWGRRNLLDTYGPFIYSKFRHREIFNVGVLAGRGHAIRDLSINIYASAINRPGFICDQSTFNFIISSEPYRSSNVYARSEDGWACQLGTIADPVKFEVFGSKLLEPRPKLNNDKVVTSKGVEYTIVHQYDRVPGWRQTIEQKYGG
jgi:hypothetical protein